MQFDGYMPFRNFTQNDWHRLTGPTLGGRFTEVSDNQIVKTTSTDEKKKIEKKNNKASRVDSMLECAIHVDARLTKILLL